MTRHERADGTPGALGEDALELTILMPCLNESETLETCIRKAATFLGSRGVAGEVLVADNGSTDGSQAIAERAGARVINVAERGYGAALRAGIDAARGRFVVMGDSDDSYDFSDLDAFLAQLRTGSQLVMGNRFRGRIERGAMPALHRYLGNPVLTGIGRLFFRSPVGDFHCGLRAFDRSAIRQLGLVCSGMEFASEMVVKATVNGLRIAEVPVMLSPDGRTRPPHLRSWRDGWRHLRFLMMFSPRWLFLYPGIFLLAAGCAAMLWILPQPRTVGGIVLDVNTLAFSTAAIVCGFQSLSFALFARLFATDAGLLPESPLLHTFASVFVLEVGLLVGLLLFGGGLFGAVFAVGLWERAGYGALDPSASMRVVLPSVTALILGMQVMLSSFFFSVLKLESTPPGSVDRRPG